MVTFSKPSLRVAAAIFSNLAVVWIVATVTATTVFTLFNDLLLVIVFIGLSRKAEGLLEEL